jgi:hypothetical protein
VAQGAPAPGAFRDALIEGHQVAVELEDARVHYAPDVRAALDVLERLSTR